MKEETKYNINIKTGKSDRLLTIGVIILILLTVGEPDLLDGIIHQLMKP